MNTQVYVVKPDGTGLRRLTDGGKETNNLGGWTRDGKRIAMGSNRANPSAIDAYLIDPANGERQTVSSGKGLQTLEDVSRDGSLALSPSSPATRNVATLTPAVTQIAGRRW